MQLCFFMKSNSRISLKLNCNLSCCNTTHCLSFSFISFVHRFNAYKKQKYTPQKSSCLNSIEENALFHRSEKTENQFGGAIEKKKKSLVFKHCYSKSFLLQSKHMWLKVHSFDWRGAQNSTKCLSVLSLEDLALVEGFPHVFEFSLPGKILFNHGLALIAVWIQLAPVV